MILEWLLITLRNYCWFISGLNCIKFTISFTLGAFILIPLGFNNGGLSKTGLELPCFGHSYLILRCWCGMRTLFIMHFLKWEESFTMRIFCKCANYGHKALLWTDVLWISLIKWYKFYNNNLSVVLGSKQVGRCITYLL